MTISDADQAPSTRQAEKSAAMRRRICEATTRRIALAGYHRTSIAAVVAESDVSPGALQHHFPTKLDLMTATAEFLLARSVRWFARIKDRLKDGPDAFAEAMRRSWREQFRTDEYAALLEIMVAARTDKQLSARIAPALARWSQTMRQEMAATFPADADEKRMSALINLSRAMMTGLVVHDALTEGDRALNRIAQDWLDIVASRA